jgi:hypothetical protein
MDPMNLDRDPSTIANAAAEEVRALNHKTLAPSWARFPSNLYDVNNALMTLAERLPQALAQVAKELDRFDRKDLIGMDDGSEAAVGAARALAGLQQAQAQASALYRALYAAQGQLGRMSFKAPAGYRDEETADAEGAEV